MQHPSAHTGGTDTVMLHTSVHTGGTDITGTVTLHTSAHTEMNTDLLTPVQSPQQTSQSMSKSKRVHVNSPLNSPHNQGKVGPKRRRRTLQVSPPKSAHSLVNREKACCHKPQKLKLQDFNLAKDETDSEFKLTKQIFSYLLQKLASTKCEVESTLKPLREFIMPTPAQLADQSPSTIYYMDLIDENADSEETMATVADMVLEKLAPASQNCVILVGDGKTYEHLRNVKRMYGSACEKLYIFPGDWHNYIEKFSTSSDKGLLSMLALRILPKHLDIELKL